MGEGTITTLEWAETTWGGKPADAVSVGVTLAAVEATIEGAIEGRISDRWLMSYSAPGTAEFTGLTEVTGRIGDREGTVVLRHVGRMEAGNLSSEFVVAAGSGTGGLAGLAGAGTVTFTAPEGPTRYTFEPR